jgi:hypothetical protein
MFRDITGGFLLITDYSFMNSNPAPNPSPRGLLNHSCLKFNSWLEQAFAPLPSAL